MQFFRSHHYYFLVVVNTAISIIIINVKIITIVTPRSISKPLLSINGNRKSFAFSAQRRHSNAFLTFQMYMRSMKAQRIHVTKVYEFMLLFRSSAFCYLHLDALSDFCYLHTFSSCCTRGSSHFKGKCNRNLLLLSRRCLAGKLSIYGAPKAKL